MTVRLYRLLAALCDLLIATTFFLLWGWMKSTGGVGWWFVGSVLFVVLWMEVCWRLRGSPGKAMFNLGVSYRSRGTVYLRELVGKAATWCTMGFGLLPIFSSQQRALHDYIANTDVSKVPNASGLVDGLRIGFAAVMGGFVVLAVVGEKNSSSDASQAATTSTPAKAKVSDLSKAVMTIHVFRGKDEYAQGSGFLIDDKGTAVSNVHVIGSGDRAEVELEDGRKFAVTDVRAYDMTQDVAIFKIGAIGNTAAGALPTVPLGSSDSLNLGDKVVVIGSPEGLSNTVTEGILSARRGGDQPALQVSAAISPGSSGGAVFDDAGRVVGVVQSQWEEGENLNFAIPVEVVNMLLKKPDMNVTTQRFFTNVLHRDVNSDKDYDEDDSTTTTAKQ